MTDREKVIKGLECHLSRKCETGSYSKDICPYWEDDNCSNSVMNDALKLLKEQEPKSVLSERECETLPNHYERKGFCPKCHQVVEWYLNRAYCGFCGQAVKWDG